MSIRHVMKVVAASGAATVCATVFMLGLGSGVAGASSLVSPDGNTTISTTGTVLGGTPYSSGQKITVSVAANSSLSYASLFAAGDPNCSSSSNCTGTYYVEECADPGGAPGNVPLSNTGCEGLTDNALATKTSTGAFTLSGLKAYKIVALPDGNLGAGTMTAGTCGTDPNQCVLGIFAENPQSANGFAYPHLWSAAWQVTPQPDGTDSGANPGDGTPEVPFAIGLPLAAIAVVGGVTIRNRKRAQRVA